MLPQCVRWIQNDRCIKGMLQLIRYILDETFLGLPEADAKCADAVAIETKNYFKTSNTFHGADAIVVFLLGFSRGHFNDGPVFTTSIYQQILENVRISSRWFKWRNHTVNSHILLLFNFFGFLFFNFFFEISDGLSTNFGNAKKNRASFAHILCDFVGLYVFWGK